MKRAEVQVGHIYITKVSGRLCRVRIEREHHFLSGSRGWEAVNVETGRQIFVRSAARLRREAVGAENIGIEPTHHE